MLKPNAWIATNNPYDIDKDSNGIPIFTEKNEKILRMIIALDSTYQSSKPQTVQGFLKSNGIPTNYQDMETLVKLLDRENSTHLASSGKKKGSNQGIQITATAICNIKNLRKRLQGGDKELVSLIAKAVPGRTNYSFATKFCTYCNRYAFGGDEFSIYDAALRDSLPYYAYVYCKKNLRNGGKANSAIARTYGDPQKYGGYCKLIDDIRNEINQYTSLNITREVFDLFLWYFFKNNKNNVDAACACVGDPYKILVV